MTTTDTQTVMPTPTPETDGEAAVLVKRLVRTAADPANTEVSGGAKTP